MNKGFWEVRDSTTYLENLKKNIKQSLPYWMNRWGKCDIDTIVWSLIHEDVYVAQEIEDIVRMIVEENLD